MTGSEVFRRLSTLFLTLGLFLITAHLFLSGDSRAQSSESWRPDFSKPNEILFDEVYNYYLKKIENDPEFQIENDEIFKEYTDRLVRSYYLLFDFDKKLENRERICSSRETNIQCIDPMDDETYKELLAIRSQVKNIKEFFKYFYLRLMDLSYVSSDDYRPAFQDTIRILNRLTDSMDTSDFYSREEKYQDIASDAEYILNIWASWLSQLNITVDRYNVVQIEAIHSLVDEGIHAKRYFDELQGVLDLEEHVEFPELPIRDFDLTDFYESHQWEYQQLADKFGSKIPSFGKVETRAHQQTLSTMDDSRGGRGFVNHTGSDFRNGEWALTYDDGPHIRFTPFILDVLENYEAHATFFWLAKNVRGSDQREVVKRAKELGMSLASHSYSHPNLAAVHSNLNREIREARRVLELAFGKKLNYFRLPYGAGLSSARVKKFIADEGLDHFFWNVDSLDWKDPSPKSIYNRVLRQMSANSGGIILFHDINPRSYRVTEMLLDYIQRNQRLKIIRLEDGRGMFQTANGPLVSETSFSESKDHFDEGHYRIILSSVLNVRMGPSTNYAVCGQLVQGERVEVVERDSRTGWFRLDTSRQGPFKTHFCGRYAYISSNERLSTSE